MMPMYKYILFFILWAVIFICGWVVLWAVDLLLDQNNQKKQKPPIGFRLKHLVRSPLQLDRIPAHLCVQIIQKVISALPPQ